jgi:hypothetical protein
MSAVLDAVASGMEGIQSAVLISFSSVFEAIFGLTWVGESESVWILIALLAGILVFFQ